MPQSHRCFDMRLDVWLHSQKLSPSRSKAAELIRAGEVELETGSGWKQITDPAFAIGADFPPSKIRIKSDASVLRFVSRGGLKLEAALARLKLDVTGWRCLDVGQSTGGFTHCLLGKGASAILGIDVGHNQLHKDLLSETRIVHLEGCHVRDLPHNEYVSRWLEGGLQLSVIDVSFISLLAVLKPLAQALPPRTPILALVKPQFELEKKCLDKRGVVHDVSQYEVVRAKILEELPKLGYEPREYFPSELRGQDGNQEYFVWAEFVGCPGSGLSGD